MPFLILFLHKFWLMGNYGQTRLVVIYGTNFQCPPPLNNRWFTSRRNFWISFYQCVCVLNFQKVFRILLIRYSFNCFKHFFVDYYNLSTKDHNLVLSFVCFSTVSGSKFASSPIKSHHCFFWVFFTLGQITFWPSLWICVSFVNKLILNRNLILGVSIYFAL